MGKKKKGGKGKGGGSKSKQPVDIEIPPEPSTLTLLYRKASFDVRSEPLQGLLRIQYDKHHRAVVPSYCEYLKKKSFWMSGDDIPEGAIPRAPATEGAKSDKKGKKK